MTVYTGTYQPATQCTGEQPGARALMSWFLGAYGSVGGGNGGIYNCRRIDGSNQWSVHSEGRACDLAVSPIRQSWGDVLADMLRNMSAELGIQGIIYNRRQWFSSQSTWTARGPDHDDHLHVELTRASARDLTAPRIQEVLSGTGPTPTPPEEENEMRLIQSTGRGIALIGAGYYRHLANSEEVACAVAIAGSPVAGNDRQFDVWKAIALQGTRT